MYVRPSKAGVPNQSIASYWSIPKGLTVDCGMIVGKKYTNVVTYTTNTGLCRIGRPPKAGKSKSRSHVKKGWAPLI